MPASVLPEVGDCAAEFGICDAEILGAAIPIRGVAGDQQAAVVGQRCFRPGMVKSTYGTGCFALINTGDRFVLSENRLITTIAYRLAGQTTYALEGSIFMAGAVVQWLRDALQIIDTAAEAGTLAAGSDPDIDVYMVPAFVGLGAPWWDAEARGAIFGMTRNTGRAELARAALEAVCFPDRRPYRRHAQGLGQRWRRDHFAGRWRHDRFGLDDAAPRRRPRRPDRTPGRARDHGGGRRLACGFQAGLWCEKDVVCADEDSTTRFSPHWDAATRTRRLDGWHDAVRRTLVSHV